MFPVICFLIRDGALFRMEAIDTTPIYCDEPEADSMDVENWAAEQLEKRGLDLNTVIQVSSFPTTEDASRAWASWLSSI